MELVICNGHTYYVPVCKTTSISNFQRWEQAFRVFANIYTKTNVNANRSSELIEYNQIIHTASLNFVWKNVYMYDKDFRLHMAWNPQRNWGIILQQAWSLQLHDRINSANFQQNYNSSNNQLPSENRERINEPCKHYNRGRCSFGSSCKYDRRCSYCFKLGHSILTCRKLIADRDRNQKRWESSGGNSHHHHYNGLSKLSHHKENNNGHSHNNK